MSEIIPIGPYHPLQEEPEFFRLHVEGEKVTKLDIEIGYNHRGIEKLAESKSWDQVVFLVERICPLTQSGSALPVPIIPSPPALETAETSSYVPM